MFRTYSNEIDVEDFIQKICKLITYFINCISLDIKMSSVQDTIESLSNALEGSKYKDLISEGLFLFSQCLEGKPMETKRLLEPVQKTMRILGEDIEEEMSKSYTTSDGKDNVVGTCTNRLIGKMIKREMYLLSGEDVEEEEKTQMKQDGKQLFDYLLKILESH